MIAELDFELADRGVELAFAEMKDPVKDRLLQVWPQVEDWPRLLLSDGGSRREGVPRQEPCRVD